MTPEKEKELFDRLANYCPDDKTPERLYGLWISYGVVPGPIYKGRFAEVELRNLTYVASFPAKWKNHEGKLIKHWYDLYLRQPEHTALADLREKLKQEGNELYKFIQAPVTDSWYCLFDSDDHIESSAHEGPLFHLLLRREDPWRTAADILISDGKIRWYPCVQPTSD